MGPIARGIVEDVAADHGLAFAEVMTSGDRPLHAKENRPLLCARYDAMFRLRQVFALSGGFLFSQTAIGSMFGCDHTTVVYGVRWWAQESGLTPAARFFRPDRVKDAAARTSAKVASRRAKKDKLRKARWAKKKKKTARVNTRWTPALDAALEAAYLAPGATTASAALAIGVSRRRASDRIQKFKLSAKLSPEEAKARQTSAAQVGIRACHAKRKARGEMFWTPETDARLRREFLDYGDDARAVAKRMGLAPDQVWARVVTLKLTSEMTAAEKRRRRGRLQVQVHKAKAEKIAATGQFAWTQARCDLLTRLYVEQDKPSSVCAQEIGAGCTAKMARRKAAAMGLVALRRAKGVKMRRVAKLTTVAAETQVVPVILLRTGHAAGTTRWEQALHTAPPPRPDTEEERARRQRATRKTQLAYAANGGHRTATLQKSRLLQLERVPA